MKTGVQNICNLLKTLDSGFRRNDVKQHGTKFFTASRRGRAGVIVGPKNEIFHFGLLNPLFQGNRFPFLSEEDLTFFAQFLFQKFHPIFLPVYEEDNPGMKPSGEL